MKRIFLSLIFLFMLILPANADILPYTTNDIKPEVIGLYQVPLRITVYAKPDKKSDVVFQANWDYKTFNASSGNENSLFAVLVKEKELAYVLVSDSTEDWTEIIYDKNKNKKGWIQTEDLRFMTWRSFQNLYGRKYGLYYLKGAPTQDKNIHGSTNDDSPIIQRFEKPQKIRLTVIKGNWALVTIIENNEGKTGYVRWRSDNGTVYMFPAIK